MRLIIGGANQGKLKWYLSQNPSESEEIMDGDSVSFSAAKDILPLSSLGFSSGRIRKRPNAVAKRVSVRLSRRGDYL